MDKAKWQLPTHSIAFKPSFSQTCEPKHTSVRVNDAERVTKKQSHCWMQRTICRQWGSTEEVARGWEEEDRGAWGCSRWCEVKDECYWLVDEFCGWVRKSLLVKGKTKKVLLWRFGCFCGLRLQQGEDENVVVCVNRFRDYGWQDSGLRVMKVKVNDKGGWKRKEVCCCGWSAPRRPW